MGAGTVYTAIVENPTALTISAAMAAMVTATNTTARYTITALGMGKGILITGISQA